MKFKELYIKGPKEELDKFVDELKNYAKNGWLYRTDKFLDWTYHFYRKEEYGIEVSILYNERKKCYYVPNVLLLQSGQLTKEEYNSKLQTFKDEVVSPCKNEKFSDSHIVVEVEE